jgi:inorganic pyrophosphatase
MDALVVTDESLVTGCLVRCRILGVIETRKSKNGRKVKDDRLVVVPTEERGLARLQSLEDLGDEVHEIEQFFVAYNRTHGKPLEILGRGGSKKAQTLLKAALR